MTCIYTTEGGWDIEVEYSYYKGTTPPGGDDPEDLFIIRLWLPFGPAVRSLGGNVARYCKAFKIDIEDIESQIRDENL